MRKARLLLIFPELGWIVPELDPAEQVRELVYRTHRIIYRVDHGRRRVEVARFWHGARGMPEL